MKTFKRESIETFSLETITCDICKKIYNTKHIDDNYFGDNIEIGEFHCIDFVGGYGSIFGDMNRVQCDICQDCLAKLLGEYLRINDKETNNVTENIPENIPENKPKYLLS